MTLQEAVEEFDRNLTAAELMIPGARPRSEEEERGLLAARIVLEAAKRLRPSCEHHQNEVACLRCFDW